jgi:limonene-1,2-epoxide hydrolase
MGPIDDFYAALARGDWAAVGAAYADDAQFSDPVFPHLDATQVRAMWRMLLTADSGLQVTHQVLHNGRDRIRCRWEARYAFGRERRPVHNIVTAEFILRDGRIVHHRDHFDLWRWSRQALGPVGLLLGWTPWLRRRVRAQAARSLARAMANT